MEIKRIDSTLPTIYQPQYPVLYNGGLPAEIDTKTKKKKKSKIQIPWINKKIHTYKWSDFFRVEKNKMIVYKIIPHSNVTNNNRRLWKAIYKMYEMHEHPGTR